MRRDSRTRGGGRAPFWLTAWFVWVLLAAVRAVAVGADVGRPIAVRPAGIEPRPVALDRDRLDVLALLPGLGRTRAEAVVLDRVRNGPVPTVAALTRIPGIGPGTVAGLEPHAVVLGQPAGPDGPGSDSVRTSSGPH